MVIGTSKYIFDALDVKLQYFCQVELEVDIFGR